MTFSSRAIFLVAAVISAFTASLSENGGMTQALSPE